MIQLNDSYFHFDSRGHHLSNRSSAGRMQLIFLYYRIFVAIDRAGSSYRCCHISTCRSNIMDCSNGSLLASDNAPLALQLAIFPALSKACQAIINGLTAEIVAHQSTGFTFTRVGTKLSEIERICADTLAPTRIKSNYSSAIHPRKLACN